MTNNSKPGLADLMASVQAGVARIKGRNNGASSAGEPVDSDTPTVEVDRDELVADDRRARIDGLDDAIEIDPDELEVLGNEAPQPKQNLAAKIAALSNKQKGLLIAAVVAGVLILKQQVETAATPSQPTSEQVSDAPAESAGTEEGLPFPTSENESSPQGGLGIDNSTGIESGSELGSPADEMALPRSAEPGSDSQLTEFAQLDDPLTAETQSQTKPANPLDAVVDAPVEAPVAKNPVNPLEEQPLEQDNPLAAEGKSDPVLGGDKPENKDSKGTDFDVLKAAPELAAANVETGALNTDILAKDAEITALTKKLEAQNKELLLLKNGQQVSKPAKVSNYKRPIAAKKAPALVRPKICVNAIVQAARNCSTCVPHAFIVKGGAENMVGQGDSVDGLRVSIVGDRLDLQDASGETVHKFWSSPNGCVL